MATTSTSVAKGTRLFHAGDECPGFVTVHSGTIKVVLTAENGREIVLYRVNPGEVCLQTFGCLTSGHPYSAEGIAETDLTVEVLPEPEFQRRIVEDAQFRAQLFSGVSARFSDMERLIEDVALSGLQARLARLLLRIADQDGQIEITHEALASEIGSGRAAITRTLREFVRRGLIEARRGAIVIQDRTGLEAISHAEV